MQFASPYNATITLANVTATNGVVNEISSVLVPPSVTTTARRIKATPETRLTPVVLITGLSATEDRIMGINSGADDFLSKPIDLNELLARTRSLLRLKQYTDELENAEGGAVQPGAQH